jgi:hypothetical protein
MTGEIVVNKNSPQMGQSHSKLRSMHLCVLWYSLARHALHLSQWTKLLGLPRRHTLHFSQWKIFFSDALSQNLQVLQ